MINIIRISRPRFWLYLFGTYLIGLAAGATSPSDFYRVDSLIFGLYFLLPANLLVYGINDIFDFETDRLNPKKAEYEMLVRPESHRKLFRWILILNVPFIVAAVFTAPRILPSLGGFLFLSIFYSAPPVRAKEAPFIDSIFNILYVFPGACAYQLVTGHFPPVVVLFTAGMWAMAMHAYSAIPDIEADRSAGVETIATTLGSTGTHSVCVGLFAVAGIACAAFAPALMLFGLAYASLTRHSSYSTTSVEVFKIYRWFPFINAACGFAIFLYCAWPKFF